MARTAAALVLVAILGAMVALPARSGRAEPAADHCLGAPNGAPSPGKHWYYRTDRSISRRCWYLGPEGAKVIEARTEPAKAIEVREASRARPSSGSIAEPKAQPPAETIARTIEPAEDAPMPSQPVLAAAAPIDRESPPATHRDAGAADDPLEMRSPRVAAEPIGKQSIRPVEPAADLGTGATSDVEFWDMLAIAAAMALAASIARKVFRLLVVRRLRRRRAALRRQWEALRATCPVGSTAAANSVPAAHRADLAHRRVAATRSADTARRRETRRAPNHDRAEYAPGERGERSLKQLLRDLQRTAA